MERTYLETIDDGKLTMLWADALRHFDCSYRYVGGPRFVAHEALRTFVSSAARTTTIEMKAIVHIDLFFSH
jgi:hypothetical protein